MRTQVIGLNRATEAKLLEIQMTGDDIIGVFESAKIVCYVMMYKSLEYGLDKFYTHMIV
ncbi:hypothetical protein AGMMS49950_06110 [Endomicrobiia bacterium]|nr:hypothetical protein AGMMS49950_06110 [Endomicrobiia bacterium]